MFEYGQELYSSEIVRVMIKEIYHAKDSQFECSSAESVSSNYFCEAIVFTRDNLLASEIVKHGSLGGIRKYDATIKTLEVSNDNNGESFRFTFHFFK